MRSKKTSGLIFTIIFITSFKALAGISPAEKSAWDYRDFCESTVPAYTDAYKDGEREIIIMNLHSARSFNELGEDQKKAFLRLLDYFASKENNGESEKAIKSECQSSIDKALSITNWGDHQFCRDVALKVIKLLGKDIYNRESNIILGLAYRKCMVKKLTKRH